MKLKFKDDEALRGFASLNMPNNFKFIIGSHCYYMPQILADFLSPAVSDMHIVDPTLNQFIISDVSDDDFFFELIMSLSIGETIEVTSANSFFLEIVGSKLMNEEIVLAASNYSNTIFPISVNNAILRLCQKESIGILPINEIEFISENFWALNPNDIFKIPIKCLHLILSHPKLKIINEDWLFLLIMKLVKDKGNSYRTLLSNISIADVSMICIQNFFESQNELIDDFIYRSVQEKLTFKLNDENRHKHFFASQSEINYVFSKADDQKDVNGYSFNSIFFKEYPMYNDKENECATHPFESDSSFSPFYDFNNKFNPFEPTVKKPFPDYFSSVRSKSNIEKSDQKKRSALIDEECNNLPYSFAPINILYSGKSERIPVNFTNTNFGQFEEEDFSDSEEVFKNVSDQFFANSQKIFDNNNLKGDEQKEENQKQRFFEKLKSEVASFFTPSTQADASDLIPSEKETTSVKPESIFQNPIDRYRSIDNQWPIIDHHPPSEHESDSSHDDPITADGESDEPGFRIPIHDEGNGEGDEVQVNRLNKEDEGRSKKHDDFDDDPLDAYGDTEKDQY